MILQSLIRLCDTLVEKDEIIKDGWGEVEVKWQLDLNEDGTLAQIINIEVNDESDEDGWKGKKRKKKKTKPQKLTLPSHEISRGRGKPSDFLYGNCEYIFGVPPKGKNVENDEKLKAALKDKVSKCNKLHHEILDKFVPNENGEDGLDATVPKLPEAKAVLLFLDRISAMTTGKDGIEEEEETKNIRDNIAELYDAGLDKSNIVISVNGNRLSGISEICRAWDNWIKDSKNKADKVEEEIQIQSLINGEVTKPVKLHYPIKGSKGLFTNEPLFTSFNADVFCSFEYENCENSPMSDEDVYAYTRALSYLINNEGTFSFRIGRDFLLVWWPESAEKIYGEMLSKAVFDNSGDDKSKEGEDSKKSSDWKDADITKALEDLSKGRPTNGMNPDMPFNMMGLSTNNKRIIVHFFIQNTFGEIIKNVSAHYNRLKLIKPNGEEGEALTTSKAFFAMVRRSTDKELNQTLIRGYLQSVLFGSRYPAQMRAMVQKRIIMDEKQAWQRTSLLKAYFLQVLPDGDKRKECFAMCLLPENNCTGYVLGRLFAIYEFAQNTGLGVNRYNEAPIHSMMGSAMQSPQRTFTRLATILAPHLAKKECGYYSILVEDIMSLLQDCNYPVRMDAADQGAFSIGYYHQRHSMRKDKDGNNGGKKKDENENENGNENESIDVKK